MYHMPGAVSQPLNNWQLLAAETVCRSIPIGSLAIGQSWQHTLLYTGLASPSMAVSLYLCHLHQQVRLSAHASCAA